MSQPTKTFRDFASIIDAQSKLPDASGRQADEVWRDLLNELYASIESWMQDPDVQGKIAVRRHSGELFDDRLGYYKGTWITLITPLSQQILIMPRVAVMGRYIGVVDVQFGDRTGFIYYSPVPNEWRVSRRSYLSAQANHEDIVGISVPLDKDTFGGILADLLALD